MIDLAADVQAYLIAQGHVDGSTGWPSTRGALHDESDQMVQIATDIGPPPELPASEGLGSAALTHPAALVTVRGKAYKRDAAQAKAAEIHDALNGLLGATLGSTEYLNVRAAGSQFAQVFDDKARPRFSMSYRALAAAVA